MRKPEAIAMYAVLPSMFSWDARRAEAAISISSAPLALEAPARVARELVRLVPWWALGLGGGGR